MNNTGQGSHMPSSAGGNFKLPPKVTFSKQLLGNNWAYIFRHQELGNLGRVVLQGRSDGKCQIFCELAGEPDDPMTIRRGEIFKPLGIALSKQLEAATGKVSGATLEPIASNPQTPKEMIESKLIPCEHCGKMVAMFQSLRLRQLIQDILRITPVNLPE